MKIWGRWTVGRLMLAVAAVAVLLGAAIYRRDNLDVDRATVALHLQRVRSGDPATRRDAAEELERADLRDAPRVVEALAGLIAGDPDPAVRRAAARTMGAALARSIIARGHSTAAVPGAWDVGAGAEDDLPARLLIRAMADPDPEVRIMAASAWDRLPEQSRFGPALAPLVVAATDRLLLDPDPTARAVALRSLPRLDLPSTGDRDRVVALMERDPDPAVRSAAIQALTRRWATPDLYAILLRRYGAAPTPEERSWIARGLAGLPAPPPEVVPGLLDLMEADPAAAQSVPPALAKLGRAGRPCLDRLRRVAEREIGEPGGVLVAAHAVVAIDPGSPEAQSLLDPLARRLRDSREWAGLRVAAILADYGPAAAPAVPTLREALGHPHQAGRQGAAQVLGRVGPGALAAVPDLERLARVDPIPYVRAEAARAVLRIRASAPETEALPESP